MKKLLSKNKTAEVLEILEEMHPEARCALNFGSLFQLVCAVSLSAQTTDVSVNKVTPVLFEKYPTPEAMASADPQDIEEIIRSIGFYRNKSRNLIMMSEMLLSEFDGDVPSDMKDLVKLPGVGRKTANVVMSEGFGMPAIAVDTHVFRVSHRIGLSDGKTPDDVEMQLKKKIEKDNWSRAHHLLIFHGRKICHARKPDCEMCKLSDICMHNK